MRTHLTISTDDLARFLVKTFDDESLFILIKQISDYSDDADFLYKFIERNKDGVAASFATGEWISKLISEKD